MQDINLSIKIDTIAYIKASLKSEVSKNIKDKCISIFKQFCDLNSDSKDSPKYFTAIVDICVIKFESSLI